MSLQSQLNNDAFSKLPKTFAEMQKATGNIKGSMEQYVFNQLMNCSPCLDNMNDNQINLLDEKIIKVFAYREWI
jgi:hypothetical protein